MLSSTTFKDKTRAARAVGSELETAVVKATNHDPVPPKRKHVATIKAEVADPSFKIATLFGYLEERFKSKTWSVVLKAQMITHELMRDPDQRVLKYVSQRPRIFNVSGFRDRCNVDSLSYVSLVDSYAIYLEERAVNYQLVQLDFVNETLADAGRLRSVDASRILLRDLKSMQEVLAKLLKNKLGEVPSDNELVLELYRLLLKDALRLYHTIQKGLVFVLEKFFKFEKDNAAATVSVYRTSLEQTSQLNSFFQTGVKIGAVSDHDVPALALPGGNLVDTLQNHLAVLNGEAPPSSAKARADDSDLPPVQQLSLAGGEPIRTGPAANAVAPAPAPAPKAAASPWDEFEAFTSSRPAAAPAAAAPAPAAATSFANFGTSLPAPAAAAAVAPAPAKPKAAEMDLFSFDDPTPTVPTSVSAKDAVMSRFNAPPAQAAGANAFFGSTPATPAPFANAPYGGGAAAPYGGYRPPAAYGAPASTNPFGAAPAPAPAYGGWPAAGSAAPSAAPAAYGGWPAAGGAAQPAANPWGNQPAASTNPFAAPVQRPPQQSQNPWGL